jgi:HEPN domain-containing protein
MTEPMASADDPKAWLAKSRGDILCIENNLAAAKVPWEAVAFHAQQAVEKALKGILVSRRADLPHTHDLGYLLDCCRAAGLQMTHLQEECDRLTPYAVGLRYPGAGPDIEEAEARKAAASAGRIVDEIERLL